MARGDHGGDGAGGSGSSNWGNTVHRPVSPPPPKQPTINPQLIEDPFYGIGDYTGDRSAEKTYTDLYKAQWQDYKNRYFPAQQELIDQVSGVDMLNEQLSRITALSKTSSRDRNYKLTSGENRHYAWAAPNAAQGAEMRRERYGFGRTAQQQKMYDSNSALSGALSLANAQNNARAAAYDQYNSTMTGAPVRPQQEYGATGGATS